MTETSPARRWALVTGAAQGIGRAIAGGLAKAGANVILLDRPDSPRLAGAVDAVRELGVETHVVRGDLQGGPFARRPARHPRPQGVDGDPPGLADGSCGRHGRAVGGEPALEPCFAAVARAADGRAGLWPRALDRQHSGVEAQSGPHGLCRAQGGAGQCDPQPGAEARGARCYLQHIGAGRDRNATALADTAHRQRVEAQIPAGRLGVAEDCVAAAVLLCSEPRHTSTGRPFRWTALGQPEPLPNFSLTLMTVAIVYENDKPARSRRPGRY